MSLSNVARSFARPRGVPTARWAPSPSGEMHLGNLFSCLIAWLSARAQGGRIILRIEDLDPQRTSRQKAEQLMRDLEWLGLDWDEGPYWQSERSGFYQACVERLAAQGLVYPCFCSRAELHAVNAPHASDGELVYSGRCRGLSEAERAELALTRRPALRLRAEGEVSFLDGHYGRYSQDLARDCGDFILRRSDGAYAYQLAAAADDGDMGVTEVVRGRDLLSSTPRQLYILRLLGLPAPSYKHIPLLVAGDGRRLSKRDGDLGLTALRRRYSREELVGWLAYLAGQLDRPEPVGAAELVPMFDWGRVPKEDIVPDIDILSEG